MAASPSGELRSSKLFSILYTPCIKVLNLIVSTARQPVTSLSHTHASKHTHREVGVGRARKSEERRERRLYVHTRHAWPILLAKLVEIKGNEDIELLFCQICWPAAPEYGLCLLQTQYPLRAHAKMLSRTQTQPHTDTHSRTLSLFHAF